MLRTQNKVLSTTRRPGISRKAPRKLSRKANDRDNGYHTSHDPPPRPSLSARLLALRSSLWPPSPTPSVSSPSSLRSQLNQCLLQGSLPDLRGWTGSSACTSWSTLPTPLNTNSAHQPGVWLSVECTMNEPKSPQKIPSPGPDTASETIPESIHATNLFLSMS